MDESQHSGPKPVSDLPVVTYISIQDKSTSIAFALNLQEELSHRNPCHEAPAAQFLC